MRKLKKLHLTHLTDQKQIRVLLIAFLAILVALFALVLGVNLNRSLPLPMKYTNADLVYDSTDQTAMQAESSFASDLCVGEDNLANENITLTGSDEHAALFSLDDKTVLFSKGMYEKVYPASITKIMTAILALKDGSLNDTVTINWQDVDLESGSQVVGLQIGDKVTMNELLHGMLIHSGNDCAQAIARHVGGSMSKFVEMMNEECTELGCTGTHFVNPTGLHDEDHYTTVYDIYLMLNAAIKYSDFVTIMQIPVYDMTYEDSSGNEKHVNLDATDHYLTGETDPPKNVTVLGGKTGTTDAAGNCLAIESQNAYGQPYISIIAGAKTKDILYTDMNSLLSQINT